MVLWKNRVEDFTRNRKLSMQDVIYYTMNNRGKSTKMELYDYWKEYDLERVSAPALLKQREKLNAGIFKELSKLSLIDFYEKFSEEVRVYKGYVLEGIDGSDCEVPNTIATRQRYQSINSTDDNRVARIKLSNCYDLLNNYVLDTQIEEYKHSEIDLAKRHTELTEYVNKFFPTIKIMDRGYFSLSFIYYLIKKGEKFIIRMSKSKLKIEQQSMQSDDEYVEIQYQYDRIANYKEKDEELYNYYMNGNRLNVRLTKVTLPTGETEILVSNLSMEEFSTEDLYELYGFRWGIETSYHAMKEGMTVTNISSSKHNIIEQEIYSQMFVYNLLKSICNDLEEEIPQERYKHRMKVNFNMAIGFIKRFLIKILIEEDDEKKEKLLEELYDNILSELVPIRKGRSYERPKNRKLTNKHPINKRKTI